MIVIAGKNDIAVHGLSLALEHFEPRKIIVITNKNDTGVDSWQRSLFKFAAENKVSIGQLEDIYSKEINVFLSLEFDRIVKPELFNTKNLYNIHFSLLPKYKGMHTSVWPILNGDKSSGVTLHKIDHGIDTGNIVAQREFSISENDTSHDCYINYIRNSKAMLSDFFEKIISGAHSETEQSYYNSSYFSVKSIDYAKLEIDFNKTAWQIKKYVQAFTFRSYQLLTFDNEKICKVVVTKYKSTDKPGAVLNREANYAVISTVDYNIEVYFDRLDYILGEMPNLEVSELMQLKNNYLGLNDRNTKGWSLIIVAAYWGNKRIVDYLLDIGANINDQNFNGTTVLMYAKDYALKNNEKTFFNHLISRGANLNLKDWSGKVLHQYITPEQSLYLGL